MRVHLQEVGRTEVIHHRLHAAGLIEISADIELLRVARRAEHCGQVPARRTSPGGEAIRIDPVFGGVRPEPADSRFAVLDLSGENGVLAQPIVDRGDRETLCEVFQRHPLFLAAHPESATVDVNDQRQIRAVLRQIQVQLLALVATGHIRQIAMPRPTVWYLGLGRLTGRLGESHRHGSGEACQYQRS